MDTSKTLGANIVNTGAGLLKGFGNVLESVLDTFLVYTTTVADSGSMATGEFVPYEGGKGGVSEEYWKDVMGYVAKDNIESGFKDFYENTDLGKALDENASNPFKSTGAVTEFASGLGEVAGIAALTAVTGGTGTGAMTATAGVTGFGKYTEEHWENTMETAKEGEDWATEDVRYKGMLYGAANGAWEAAQWAVGGYQKKISSTQEGINLINVGIDTAFNALDTPFRTLIDATTSDRTLKEAWEDKGGWTSVITNAGIGLIGSVTGEVIVLIGTSTENLKKLRHFSVSSDLPEVGIWDNVPLDNIKVIAVPGDKVDGVTELFKNTEIQVIPLDTWEFSY